MSRRQARPTVGGTIVNALRRYLLGKKPLSPRGTKASTVAVVIVAAVGWKLKERAARRAPGTRPLPVRPVERLPVPDRDTVESEMVVVAPQRDAEVVVAPQRDAEVVVVPQRDAEVVVSPQRDPEVEAPPSPAAGWRPRLQRRAPDIVFGALCLLIAVARFRILTRSGAPAGVDSGNWLALGRGLIGESQRSASIVYPPVVPLLVVGFVNFLGLVDGIAVITVMASLSAGVAVHLVLRGTGLRWEPAVLGALVAAGSATGEAAAWGGIPQLISLGVMVLFVWALDRYLRTSRLPHAALAGLMLAMVMATSHLVAFAAVLSGASLVALHLFLVRPRWRRPRWRVLLGGGLLVALPCLPLLPIYRTLAAGISPNPADDAQLVLLDHRNIVGSIDFLFRDFAVFWRLALTSAFVTPLLLWHRRRTATWAMSTCLLAGTVLATLLTRQSRYLYVLPVVIALAIAVWAAEATEQGAGSGRHHLFAALLGVALVAQLALGVSFFQHQRDYYGILDRHTVSALRWIRTATPPDSTVAVTTGKDDQLLGWWVESLTQRRTLFVSRLVWLNFEDERTRARRANALFGGPFPAGATLTRARNAGVDYLIVTKSWPRYDRRRLARFGADNPGAVVFENPSVVMIGVDAWGHARS